MLEKVMDFEPLLYTVTIGALFIAALLYIAYIGDRRKSLFKLLPSPPNYPIIGTLLSLNLKNEEFFALQFKNASLYGDRYLQYSFGHYFVTLGNPDDVEKILNSSVHINKGMMYSFISPWLGQGLLVSGGKKWQRRRKMLTPAFHFRILEDFLIIFNEQAKIMADILRKEFSDGKDRNICPYISRCTLDIIGETAMDVKFGCQSAKDSPYLSAVNTACEIILYRGTRPLAWSDFIFNLTPSGRAHNAALKTLHSFTEKVIRERKQTSPEKENKAQLDSNSDEIYWHGKRRLAFLDLLLDAQNNPENQLTDLDIREEVDTFMFEGHDTTAASLSWTVFLLGCHQECQIKVQEELDRIFGDDRTRPITSKDLTEMKYLEACIKEALRLYPSVPFISRCLTSDLVLDEKLKIPSGCDIFICTMPIHQNPSHFPDPQSFIPDRFFPKNTAKRHPYAYIPFSAGPRNCIGQKFALMEEKIILANLFRNFNIEAAQTLDSVTVMIDVITRPKNGLRVRISNR